MVDMEISTFFIYNRFGGSMKYIKKNWFIILIIVITLLRFLMSFKLPNFYIVNLQYDDKLMINLFRSIMKGEYLGRYNNFTLIKGIVFPFVMSFAKIFGINFSAFLTILYILSCIYFTSSLGDIKDNKYLLILYVILLFNPISYSSELFQRLYRNSISITELLFFLGVIIRIIKYNKIRDYIILGFILSIMFLTREDNIWTIVIVFVLFLYQIKNIKIIIPIVILVISLNIISFVNYKYYGIYTYNEINKSEIHKTYMKILKIKDYRKLDKVSITKETLHKLSDLTESFNISKKELDLVYKSLADDNGEINNGNIIWYFRKLIYDNNRFHTAKESEEYYKKLGEEIDKLTLEKEFVMPSIYINTPTISELKKLPKDLLTSVIYTSSYKNVGTLTNFKPYRFDPHTNAYIVRYDDYNNTEEIVKNNSILYEIIRQIYKYFTIIFSVISFIIYVKNIKKFDFINKILHIVFISYFIIIFGVTYTHTTAFYSIRYFYLGNVYILQSIFILLNMGRLFHKSIYK